MEFALHPLFVHFPIALITLAYFYQILFVMIPNILPKHLNLWVLIPAAISTIPAMISGQNTKVLTEKLSHEIYLTIENHQRFANITSWGIILLTIVWTYITARGKANQKVQVLMLAFLSIIFVSMCITGYLGSTLVHKWRI
tara:strand:+ start:2470 stop:2892 length:423 start_codon:yes stop_codon:yes gene_type:complete